MSESIAAARHRSRERDGFVGSGSMREHADHGRAPLTGGCNCGAVRYEVTEPLVIASYCHCRRCQRRSGAAASPSAHPAPGAFHIVAGEDRLKHWKPDDGGEKWFCGDCGSSIFGRNLSHPDSIGIRMGTSTRTRHPAQRSRVPSPTPPVGGRADDGLRRHPQSRHA